jgi:F0F1-type ATP synthase membrane subunit b/b'
MISKEEARIRNKILYAEQQRQDIRERLKVLRAELGELRRKAAKCSDG